MMTTMEKKESVGIIEHHLKNYKTYKAAIKNLQQELDDIMPCITTTYEKVEGSTGTFNIKSKTEQVVLDRMTGWRVLRLSEQKQQYQSIINSVDEAMGALEEKERQFVQLRYIEVREFKNVATKMNFSESACFDIRTNVLDKLTKSLNNLLSI